MSSLYPNLMVSLSADHVVAFRCGRSPPTARVIDCDFLFHPDEIAKPAFDPSDAIGFWDLVNRQDWRICESVQRGMASRVFVDGFYAPMEDLSLDIRRYLAEMLGENCPRTDRTRAEERAARGRPRGPGPPNVRLLRGLDLLHHVLELRIGDELVVHRRHRVRERLLVDLDDLRAAGLDLLADSISSSSHSLRM